MRNIILVLMVCCSLNCKEGGRQPSFNKENFKQHDIGFIRGTLLLPTEYERISDEKLTYIFAEERGNSTPPSRLKEILELSEADRIAYVLFVKEDDLTDIILLRRSEHMDFSKRDANQYLGMLENTIQQNWGHLEYSRLQNKMSRTERSKYIKIKYRIDLLEKSVFQTQYIVTSDISTFEVIEIRDSAMDFEDLIKRIHYGI